MFEDRGTARGDCIPVAGCELVGAPEGGLYWPAQRALIVADLHLEKGSAFARKGVMLPPYDTPDTISMIEQLVLRYRPETVIALGDSFHREDGHSDLTGEMRERIAYLTAGLRWIWVAGNHDPGAPIGLGGTAMNEIVLDRLTFRHEPQFGAGPGEIAGHLHPVARLRSRGRVIRRRCFATNGHRLVMPALGAYAGGLNVLDPAFSGVLPSRRFHAWMLGTDRVYPMRASRLVPDAGTAPARRAGAV
ncbi:MAG: ligase-associated DNA damage response endonuclease PdeM [Rhizobiales bacterium]|nr:ligase-associated DNA damage response endonuclease PdeM [Hyphomicrobiales bacterium]